MSSFWEDLGAGLTYAFPVVAAANGLGDIGDSYWGGNGPGNALTGGAFQTGGGIIPGLGGGGNAPTAQGLGAATPEQMASIQAGFNNPSAQAPIIGGTPQNWGLPDKPIYGASVRDQAMAGFNAGPREALQATAAQLPAVDRRIYAAQIDPNATQRGERLTKEGVGMANAGLDITQRGVRDQQDTRTNQVSQTHRLTAAADGRVPSVAENQMRAGLAQGLQSNLALAASNRGSGSSAVLAQRQAQNNNANLAARTNAQAATLRAGEMAQARGELSQHLGNMRNTDLASANVGTQAAGIGTQVAGIGTQMQGIGAQLGTAQAGLNQQAGLANQATALAADQANLNAAQQTQIANLNAQMTQRGMDDQQKMAYLGHVLGIDARTQQGQQQLMQMLVNAHLTTEATNAGISLGNAQNATNQQNGMLSGAATLGAALI